MESLEDPISLANQVPRSSAGLSSQYSTRRVTLRTTEHSEEGYEQLNPAELARQVPKRTGAEAVSRNRQ